ncbi:MAG TPA: hypothetical protein PLU50_11325, partial [Pseudobdellovibrionaceae bacterium]|nr:hypothetical protein [Pseudobdellovibrionaceae bacterium]
MQTQFLPNSRLSKMFLVFLVLILSSCASNPNKAKEVQTEMENPSEVGAGVKVGLNEKGEMITRKKVAMNEALAQLQQDVNEMEIDIYGDETLGRSGLYGVLSECLDRSVEKKNGGDGKLKRLPEKAILVPPEEATQVKIGLDENNKLVAV